MILTIAVAAAVLLARGGRERTPIRRVPPFELEHPAVDPREGGVLLYVSASCRWCEAELQAWDSLLASGTSDVRAPTVVMAPGAPGGWRDFLPKRLAPGALLDADGSLARGLGVGAVPFRARVAPGGRVEEVSAGLSDARERGRLFTFLNQPSTPPEEVR
jgi:hypothetical protein